MKNYKEFLYETIYRSSPSVHYYNSHGNWSTYNQIRDIEAVERGNYPIETFNQWQDKYSINDNDEVLWVTPDKRMAYRYLFNADKWDAIPDMSLKAIQRMCRKEYGDCDLAEVTDDQGFIIPESDDGDNGYLFVKR